MNPPKYSGMKLCISCWTVPLIFLLLFFSGCQPPAGHSSDNTRTINDMLGREVVLPEKIHKVVGIGPGALRLLVYMQAVDRIAGVEEIEKRSGRPYIFAHPVLKHKPAIGPAFTGDPELIAACNPDVIIRTYTTSGEANELQRKTGIPVVALRYVNQSQEWRVTDSALNLLGTILDRRDRSRELTNYYHSLIDTLRNKTAGMGQEDKPRVYLGGLSHRGTHGITSTSPYYEPFAFTRARNVATPLRSEYPNNEGVLIDPEQIMVWNPHILFIDLAGKMLVEEDIRDRREFYTKITAFQENQVYGVHPYNWYSTNHATVLANAWFVGSVLYPGRFSDTAPKKKADEIYRFFLGRPVYDSLKSEYGGYGSVNIGIQNISDH